MSSDDKTGAEGESFLSRWSRLKARGGGDDKPAPTALIDANATPLPAQVGEQLADDAPSLIDLTKLPRLEELTSGSDFAAFLQKGVPEELKRLALRKAWSLDPAIRDFIEVAENQGNWNIPGDVPGYGPLEPGTDIEALLAQATGAVKKIAAADDDGGNRENVTADVVAADQASTGSTPASTVGSTPGDATQHDQQAELVSVAVNVEPHGGVGAAPAAAVLRAAPQQMVDANVALSEARHRRHGGALPG